MPSQPYSTPTLENSLSIATSSKPKVLHHMEKCILQRTRCRLAARHCQSTNTIVFIAYNEIPPQVVRASPLRHCCQLHDREGRPLCAFDSQVGGNRITYPGDCGTPTADMLTTKILLNSTTSLNSKLDKLVTTDGYVYVLIQKECTGSHRRASSLNNSLKKVGPQRLPAKFHHTWFLETRLAPYLPSLCMLTTLVSNMLASNMYITFYKLSTNTTNRHKTGRVRDTSGSQSWDYTLEQVQLSMPGYCKSRPFHHPVPIKPQHQPYPHTPHLRAKQQFVDTADDSALLSTPTKPSSRKSSESSCTTHELWTAPCYLHWGPPPPNGAPTQNTMSKVHQFLDYAMTHPDAMITYRDSNMILAVHSDASYLLETKARSRAGDIFSYRRRSVPPQQWRHLNPRTNHQTLHVFSS
eukprot:CCRYP_018699-RA/>CCRYP_018699-RA protein AED:0.27 eAED:0.27 QI:0/0/0/1/0/0/2/0/408